MNLQQLAEQKRWGKGKSEAAALRRDKRARGLRTFTPGETVHMTGGRTYFVAPDGSLRKIPKIEAANTNPTPKEKAA